MKRSSPRLGAMLLAAAGLAALGQPASAKDTPKGKWDQDKAYGYCGSKEGATFWASADGANYGCGYKGGGGLMCDKDGGCVESDGVIEEGQEGLERWAPLGLLGLLGLAGLAGLGARSRRGSEPVR